MRPRTWSTNSGRTEDATSWAAGRLLGVDDDLGDAVPVAQVEEDELPEVAATVHPAGQGDVAPDIGWCGHRRR